MEERNEIESLRILKKKFGWSYYQIAKEIGVHPQTVMDWLKGKYSPRGLSKKAIQAFLSRYI